MCGRGVLAAFASRTERQAKFAIERQCLRRQVKDCRHVHQCVIGLVQVRLPAVLLHVVAELNTAEPERVCEDLRRDIGAVAMVLANARAVLCIPLEWRLLELLQPLFKLCRVVGHVGARGLDVFGLVQIDVLATDLLANKGAGLAALAVHNKLGCRLLLDRALSKLLAELLNSLFFGVPNAKLSRPIAEHGCL